MALSANTVWEVRNGGSDTNGGGFVTGSGGTDYSQQTAAQLSVTDAACTGNTTVTSATGGFTTAMIGSIMYLSSGPGWYQITARTDTNTVTIDRNGPNATGMTANVGGAFASPAVPVGLMVDGNITYVKYSATTYDVSTATYNVSNGAIRFLTTNTSFVGYDTTRTIYSLDANRPTIKATAGSLTLLYTTGSVARGLWLRNFILDGNSQTTVVGANTDCDRMTVSYVKVTNTTSSAGWTGGSNYVLIYFCEVSNCPSGFGTANFLIGCIAHDNTGDGFLSGQNYSSCISYSNGGKGFNSGGFNAYTLNCVAYDNTSDGFRTDDDGRGGMTINCIAYGNGGYGITSGTGHRVLNCATGSNTSGGINGSAFQEDNVTLTADPFTDKASGDFSLNTTAGGGAACRAAGLPGAFLGSSTTGYLDIGAAQHADPAGGLSVFTRRSGVMMKM